MADRPDHTIIPPLASATFHRDGRRLTASLRGELDMSSTPSIAGAIDTALAPGDERLRIDLAQVSFCDSSGLAMLYRLRKRSIDEGFDLALVNPRGAVRRILEMCDRSAALPVITDLDAPFAAAD